MARVAMRILVAAVLATAPGRSRAATGEGTGMVLDEAAVERVVATLVERHGASHEARIRSGVSQAAMFWRAEDGSAGDFESFCVEHFLADPQALDATFDRFDRAFEALGGHEIALTRVLREPLDLDVGPNLPVDLLFGALNPFDHLSDDLFRSRVAFAALLNFPLLTARQIAALDAPPTREDWARIRLAQAFALRIPGELKQEATLAATRANHYIDGYNIHTRALRTPAGEHPFPDGPKLISHWGLRDHIKAMYADARANLDRQRLIRKVMERVILQEIPAAVIDNADLEWDPVTNQVFRDGRPADASLGAREDDRRYARILDLFHVERRIDAFSPMYPTYIERQFERARGIPEAAIEALLVSVLEDPVAGRVADLIRRRLGRPLEPHDIWYDGFKARGAIPEGELDAKVRERFPTLAAFHAALPDLLARLGFAPDTARFLAERIAVDPARGAGHAMGAGMRTDLAHLRTRVPPGGMDYKGYNIAMHELGHTVEQTFSLYRVDRVILNGVPNTAFTEAMAFLFQERDLDVLGLGRDDATARALLTLDVFWSTREIAGVALLDMRMWRWLYEHPDATPAALREAVVTMARDLWNRYYAPVLKTERDSPLLAIYSHMVAYALYLPDYPIGHLIHFQIDRFLEGKDLGREIERMCVQGRISPEAWMLGAVGEPLSSRPLLDATAQAVRAVKSWK